MYSAYQQAAARQQQQSKQNYYSDMFRMALADCYSTGISHEYKQNSSGEHLSFGMALSNVPLPRIWEMGHSVTCFLGSVCEIWKAEIL